MISSSRYPFIIVSSHDGFFVDLLEDDSEITTNHLNRIRGW